MTEIGKGVECVEVSDGVAGYLRDNPNGQIRFFDLMAYKAAMDTPNKDAAKRIWDQAGREIPR